jgi:peptidyl-prolyl cis-trans isomerase D
MFNIVQNKRLLQVILAIIILPFLFFGVDSYFRGTGPAVIVATVGGERITEQEFNRALRERQEAIQRITEGRADADLLNSIQLRAEVLEAMVRQRVLLHHAERRRMVVTDGFLQSVISGLPAFQSDGRFSLPLYEQYVRSQGMTPPAFEGRLRQDLVLQQLDDAIGGTAFVPRTVVERLARLSEQKREVSLHSLVPEEFTAQVKLDPEAAKKYYDTHPQEFRIPEQVRVEYVTLTMDSLLPEIALDPAEVRKYYEAHRAQYEGKEERQASHILVAVEPGANEETKQETRARAEEIHKQLVQKPGSFAELAKQHSQDPGSAERGGDLGYFGRGIMPRPFEEAVFRLNVGEISPVVETQYGFHIVRLLAVKAAESRSFEDVRGEIERELKRQLAARKFAAVAVDFQNTVFEQWETLQPAAELARVGVRQSGWVSRERAGEARLNHRRVLQAIFSEDVLKNKRNTEAIEVEPAVLVAARVIEHKPATMRSYDEVREAIVQRLTLQQAAQLAAQEGRARLEQLRQGNEVPVRWGASRLVGWDDAKEMNEEVLRQAFRADAGKLPAFAGVDEPGGGYTLIRVTRVIDPEKLDPDRRQAFREGLRQMVGQEEMLAYVASLKQRAKVTVNEDVVERRR